MRTDPGQASQATFRTGTVSQTVDISPLAKLTITPSGSAFSFDLTVTVANIDAATGCPGTATLVSSFGIFGKADPIDVGLSGTWNCSNPDQYTATK